MRIITDNEIENYITEIKYFAESDLVNPPKLLKKSKE